MTEIIIRGHEINRKVDVHIEGELKDIITTIVFQYLVMGEVWFS